MNLLAFAFHTACDCIEILWQQAREAVGTRVRFFQDLYTITAYVLFPHGKASYIRSLWKSIAHLELLILSSYSCRTPAYDALLGRI